MDFLSLFIVALMPVLETLLVTAVGLVLGMESINLLGTISRQYLNKLVFFVFTPSLIVSALADTITLDGLGTLWFMLVNVLITFLIGSALAWILIKITRAPQHLQSLIIGCCAAGNLGNLLLIILPAVCEGDDSPFGDSSVCSTDAEAYAALSMAVQYIYGLMCILSCGYMQTRQLKTLTRMALRQGITFLEKPRIYIQRLAQHCSFLQRVAQAQRSLWIK